jgi:hypothetical protein
MIAKKNAEPDSGHAEETRKVDSMSELVAGMLLDDPDATAPPPPDPSPSSMSAVRPMAARSSSRPIPYVIEEAPQGPRVGRIVAIALIIAVGLAAVVTAVLLTG